MQAQQIDLESLKTFDGKVLAGLFRKILHDRNMTPEKYHAAVQAYVDGQRESPSDREVLKVEILDELALNSFTPKNFLKAFTILDVIVVDLVERSDGYYEFTLKQRNAYKATHIVKPMP